MKSYEKGSVNFSGVVKKYGDVTALKRVDLAIEPGQLVTLLGPSGCGKTTTLRLIAGLESATEGRIYIGGEDVTHLSATYRKVSMVFQSYALFPHMTVLENVAYGMTVRSAPKKEALEKAEQGLEMVGLSGFGSRLPSELSGGQQQRVAVARAIILEPEVLLLDEPLSNLDVKLRRRVREEIRQIQQKLGLTAVYVTHDQEEAMAVSDYIIVMHNAEIAQEGSPHDLYERPNSAFTADFIGDANLIDCTVSNGGNGSTSIELEQGGVTIPEMVDWSGQGKMILRPHQIELSRNRENSRFRGEVTQAAYLGNQIQYSVTGDLGELFVVANPTEDPLTVGEAVMVSFKSQDVRLVNK